MEVNANKVSNRRGSSSKRDSDISKTKWPVVTQTTYRELMLSNATSEQVNQKVKRLCHGRNCIYNALLAVDQAIRLYAPAHEPQTPEVHLALRSIRDQLEKLFMRYPLEIRKP